MRVIDFHTHILPPDCVDRRNALCARDQWFNSLFANPRARLACAEDLVASMDQAGVDASVVFGFAFADPGLCAACNAYVLEAARQYPGRLLPFLTVNPRAGELALRQAIDGLAAGAVGIGELMPDGQGFALTDFACLDPLLELAREAGVPLMFHANEPVGHPYPGKGDQGPQQAFQLAEHAPDNTLVFSHWGGGLPFYELMPEVRAALTNTYYDTAASLFLYDDAIFRHVAAWAAPKILWATDYPLIGQARFLRRMRKLGLESDLQDRLLGGNALTVLDQIKTQGMEKP